MNMIDWGYAITKGNLILHAQYIRRDCEDAISNCRLISS